MSGGRWKFFNGRIPGEVWILGLVGLCAGISSEMIQSLLPLFMISGLGMSALSVGLVEGLSGAAAMIMKVFSGVFSDYTGRRKAPSVAGYLLSALSKPFFALASMGVMVLGARLMDRVGRGIRSAPRDALIADVTPPDLRGAAFGLWQSLSKLGSFAGPLAASGLMLLLPGDFRAVFWMAVIPALMAFVLMAFGVKEPQKNEVKKGPTPVRLEKLRHLQADYWLLVFIGAFFSLARFSEAFLVLRAKSTGMALAFIPLLIAAMNMIYALCAYPFGRLGDRVGRSGLLILGGAMLVAADMTLAAGRHWWQILLGVLLWGMHMGITQGMLSAMVAAVAPEDLRGTAFGFFNLLRGGALLAASLLAGWLWSARGAGFTFHAGAGFACVAMLLLLKARLAPGRNGNRKQP